eukprot:CAMPEP_0179961252 /NCGR_PEP_ID=MMETSP0983-20121128/29586_1 /TAXON_ID=483367 /ORGANISM="non described non described, Strain CCMP 2436" /LENGTH=73 /DNA_ID=CAMNT_0021873679 /DNA_START=13 /DNA_END=232 /DNA_ORIENTATION=+
MVEGETGSYRRGRAPVQAAQSANLQMLWAGGGGGLGGQAKRAARARGQRSSSMGIPRLSLSGYGSSVVLVWPQ